MDGIDRVFILCLSVGSVFSGISMFFGYNILIKNYERILTIIFTLLIGFVVLILSVGAIAMLLFTSG